MSTLTAPKKGEYDSLLPELFSAVEQNDRIKLNELILAYHVDLRSVENDKQETLLHVASMCGLIDMVRTLVEIYQLCAFEVDQSSCTAFHHACQHKHLHILSYLFRISGHAHINDFRFRSHHNNERMVIPRDFELHLLSAAV